MEKKTLLAIEDVGNLSNCSAVECEGCEEIERLKHQGENCVIQKQVNQECSVENSEGSAKEQSVESP